MRDVCDEVITMHFAISTFLRDGVRRVVVVTAILKALAMPLRPELEYIKYDND